jgi:cell division protein FtsX
MKKFIQILRIAVRIIFFVFPIVGAIVGFVTHDSFGMNFAVCGFIGGVIGLILAAELVLVGSVLLSFVCSFKPFRQER